MKNHNGFLEILVGGSFTIFGLYLLIWGRPQIYPIIVFGLIYLIIGSVLFFVRKKYFKKQPTVKKKSHLLKAKNFIYGIFIIIFLSYLQKFSEEILGLNSILEISMVFLLLIVEKRIRFLFYTELIAIFTLILIFIFHNKVDWIHIISFYIITGFLLLGAGMKLFLKNKNSL